MAAPSVWAKFTNVKYLCLRNRTLTTTYTSLNIQWRSKCTGATTNQYDVTIVGGGIVGLATARELRNRYPNLKFAVIEKENDVACHQSGNNSGVIHAGMYYQPGSLRAQLCTQGLKLMYEYCDKYDVPYKKCGKLIVATEPEELPRLDDIYLRGQQNGVMDLSYVDADGIREREPHCVGIKALWSPHTGIVDYGVVTKSYATNFVAEGGDIHLGWKVTDFRESENNPEYPLTVVCKSSYKFFSEATFQTRYLVTCGGLFSDVLAEKSGCVPQPRIIPFRGDYLLLNPDKRHLARANIYPVPNPKFPFLGFHFTPRMNGDVWLGPNAFLAFKKEGYKIYQLNIPELINSLTHLGLWKLVAKNLGPGLDEVYRTVSIRAQVKALQKFVPELSVSDVSRGPAGVRAQALADSGSLVEDFVFDVAPGALGQRMLHVRNAPSPAATASLAIAKMVADKAAGQFKL